MNVTPFPFLFVFFLVRIKENQREAKIVVKTVNTVDTVVKPKKKYDNGNVQISFPPDYFLVESSIHENTQAHIRFNGAGVNYTHESGKRNE
jgi:hypothetical protein